LSGNLGYWEVSRTKRPDYSEDLKKKGLKITKHRAAVLDILEQSAQPVSAEQIFLELKERDVAVNLSTVYRVLETLAEKKLINKLSFAEDNRAFFEINHMIHRHYLVCVGCKKMLAIDYCPLEGYERALEEKTHFKISGHKLNIYGLCPVCQEKEQKK